MKKYDSDTIYTTEVDGKTYCYQYAEPNTHDGGKHFSGSVHFWEEGTDNVFTFPVSVRGEDIDTYCLKILEAIEKEINK